MLVLDMEPGWTQEEEIENEINDMTEEDVDDEPEVEGPEDVEVAAMELTEGSCSAATPCGECVGECDFDSQCEGEDLECFLRLVGEITPVPGKHTLFQCTRTTLWKVQN